MNPRYLAITGAAACFIIGAGYLWFGSSHVSKNDPEVQQAIAAANELVPTIRGEREKLLHSTDEAAFTRGLASVTGGADAGQMKAGQENELGKDPWGHNFRYRILVGTESSPEKAAIWSGGKNGKFDAHFGDIKADIANEDLISLAEDDFAVIVNL